MGQRTLVTGFLAFEGFPVNPSALLAQSCDRPHALLEVAFEAVDQFLDQIDPDSFDRLLMLGVSGNGSRMQLECTAKNHVGAAPDVRGVARKGGMIEPGGPKSLPGTLWTPTTCPRLEHVIPNHDAGSYLCNYVYYRALRRLEGKRVGFLHVPPLNVIPLDRQRTMLGKILDHLENASTHLQPAARP